MCQLAPRHPVLYTDPPNDSAAKLFIKQLTLLDLLLTRAFYSNELLVFNVITFIASFLWGYTTAARDVTNRAYRTLET